MITSMITFKLDPRIEYKVGISLVFISIVSILAFIQGSTTAIIVGCILNIFIPFIILVDFYISTTKKFFISLLASVAWAIFSYDLARGWITEFGNIVGYWVSALSIFGIAIIPGFMNAFMVSSLLLDLRPARKKKIEAYPAITLLIAAYNEEENILSTLEGISLQNYPGVLKAIVINDGSTDSTAEKVRSVLRFYPWLEFIDLEKNRGKSGALNAGLQHVKTQLTITIDGDSYLFKDALKHIVERYLCDPANTAAVAGAVLVRNSRKNLVTRVQEWDYFHGIAAVKRIQSLYQGTLVAQGAFSLYETRILREINEWPACVGEDIVLTWSILNRGYRVGFAEDACLFTNAPETWSQFIKQRQRWSRGLVEAFKVNWRLLFKLRMTTLFIWWNALFFYLDLAYTLVFIPGIILALMGIFWIAGPMTMLVLPLAMIVNYIMYRIQVRMFEAQGLKVRKNIVGFLFYALLYGFILQPACVAGYFKELLFGSKKTWGTK